MTHITSLSAVEMRRLIGIKQLSPVEVLEACLDRIERYNPLINALTAMCIERAREEAREAEQMVMRGEPLGLLHGLPMGVKDLEATAGLLTTYGSPIYRCNVPVQDNLLVRRLRNAGGIVVGKTNIPEMGAGANSRNPVWGATGNPFNPNLNAGGSSGGSAASLAAELLPICTGSDTGGSLRIPASKCGVVGFRPSPGLVPNARKLLGWTPISVVGPMGRTVKDACLQLTAAVGQDAGDPLTYHSCPDSFLNLDQVDLSTLRIGWTEDFGCCSVDPVIRETFRKRIAAIGSMVQKCEEVSFDLGDVHRCFDVLRAESFVASTSEAYLNQRHLLGPNTLANYELGASMTLLDTAWAHAEQTRIMRAFQTAYADYDVIISPTTPVSPTPWTQQHVDFIDGEKQDNYYRWLALTYVVTLTTHPVISLPCGLDPQGMPFGLQITGPFRGDARTLAIAAALEAAFATITWLRRPIPDLDRVDVADPGLQSIVTAPPCEGERALMNVQVSAV